MLALDTGADGKAGNIDIVAKTVVINAAYDTTSRTLTTQGSQLTVGGTLSVPIVNAARSAFDTAQATTRTSDGRMQALGAATAGYQGYQAYQAASSVAAGGALGYKVGADLTNSHTATTSTESSSTAVGSTVWAAGNLKIAATGGGTASNLTATGATLSGSNVTLEADNAVTLQAAENTITQTSSSSGSKQTLGASYSGGAQNGFTIDIGASQSRVKGDGRDVSQVNTYVDADHTVIIRSGGNTTLSGAVLTADKVKVDVGGSLNITSLQDTSTSTSKQSGGGFDVSLCVIWCAGTPVTGSVSGNTAKGNGSYASVNESTGIQAGDGGFQVNVGGSTNLVGGVIASTQGAVDAGVNTFATGSLTTSNVVNYDIGSGRGYSLNASYSGSQSNGLSQDGTPTTSSGIGGGYGFGSAGGSQTSVTTAGISGIGGNTAVRTGDSSNGLTQQYADAGALLSEVQTQVQITSAATGVIVSIGPDVVKTIGDMLVAGFQTALSSEAGSTNVQITPEVIQAAGDQLAALGSDPGLTDAQRLDIARLQSFYDALARYLPGGSGNGDRVVGNNETVSPATQVVFPIAAAVAAATAGELGAAGVVNGGSNCNCQGHYDPSTEQWVGPPPLPNLSLDGVIKPGSILDVIWGKYADFANLVLQAASTTAPGKEDPASGSVSYPNNPGNTPGDFENIRGTRGKLDTNDGSVWERDTSGHGGEQWKRWSSKDAWERGDKPNSVWPDGRVRK